MRIGYPCINRSVGCLSSRTFRLKSYSEERLIATIKSNLECLMQTLEWNYEHDIFNFRITSDFVPLASHPICQYNWQNHFENELRSVGRYAMSKSMRISMHPGQYTLLNSLKESVVENSIKDLEYHVDVLDLMKMNSSAKIQIHVGGVYGDKDSAIKRFISTYENLDYRIRKRLVIENDERSYSLTDCVRINESTGIPVVYDTLHHEAKNNNESIQDAIEICSETWNREDGIPIIDYSSQEPNKRIGKHAESIDIMHFRQFLEESKPYDFDIMLEIKDKEASALHAVREAKNDSRFKSKPP
jgi:UV DNA damage endonuclease